MQLKVGKCKLYFLLITVIFYYGVAVAGIYKYKDANGHWQFSDIPQKQVDSKFTRSYGAGSSSGAGLKDYAALLSGKYKSINPVQEATMAVVTVKSKLGTGSGFFVTDDCYIVTNRHVIRPAKGKQWDEAYTKIKEGAASFERARLKLDNERQRLSVDKQKLNDFRRYINGLSPGREKKLAQREYSVYADRYEQNKKYVDSFSQSFNKDERKFRKQQSDFKFSSNVANIAQTFQITLKDNTKIQANLVKVSTSDDLALLKVNGCKAHHLTLSKRGVSQGMLVHAIGSPLGLRDQLTTGTVTQISASGIATDAQILPGNSGGPLVMDNGHVVAVNTLKVAKESALQTGFGISIPVSKIRKNFGQYLH